MPAKPISMKKEPTLADLIKLALAQQGTDSEGHLPLTPFNTWLSSFKREWKQGEHVVIIGQTGSGKTTVARDVLGAREYVIVIAIKRNDDTLTTYTKEHGYKRTKTYPPDYDNHRPIYWFKPEHLDRDGLVKQRGQVYNILDRAYIDGGWCLFLDDTGYVSAQLQLSQALGVLLNQSRSSKISVVGALTQPSSIAARVPSETLRQVQHYIIFPYRSDKDIKLIAEMTSRDSKEIKQYFSQLSRHDFVAISHGKLTLVSNVR